MYSIIIIVIIIVIIISIIIISSSSTYYYYYFALILVLSAVIGDRKMALNWGAHRPRHYFVEWVMLEIQRFCP